MDFLNLRTLFESFTTPKSDILEEGLGNLDAIIPELRQSFQFDGYKHVGDKSIKTKTLFGKAGENSPVLEFEIKSAKAAYESLSVAGTIGFVLRANGQQILAVGQYTTRGGDKSFKMTADMGWLREALKASGDADADQITKKLGNVFGYSATKDYADRDVGESTMKNVVGTFYKQAKGNATIDALVIKTDTDRLAKQKARSAARSDLPLDARDPRFKEKARAELKARFDKFKSSRADTYTTADEFVKQIHDKGYLEKVKIGEFVYDLYSDSISFSSLRGNKSYGIRKSYIEYRINRDTPEYEAFDDNFHAKIKELKNTITDTAELETALKALYNTKPHYGFKVILVLKGGNIVPSGEIEVDDNRFF